MEAQSEIKGVWTAGNVFRLGLAGLLISLAGMVLAAFLFLPSSVDGTSGKVPMPAYVGAHLGVIALAMGVPSIVAMLTSGVMAVFSCGNLAGRQSISAALSAPTIAMDLLWITILLYPKLGFSRGLEPLFLLLYLLSWVGGCGGIVYFFLARKSRHVTACFAVSLIGTVLNIEGAFMSVGRAVSAFM
jgi:hypothetical protein